MKYVESASTNPYYNLALEEYVFNTLPEHESCFMLWQNENTIVVGKYQNTAEEINQEAVDTHQTRVARRLSGGGAVYHDSGNLNFTVITDQSNVDDFNFRIFVLPVINALARIGVNAEFNGRNDITINGMKFSGNSQYVRHGRVLHHGCIMLDSNVNIVSEMLRPSKAKFTSKAAKSVISRVTTINANAPRPITMDEFKKLLRDEIAMSEPLEPLAFDETAKAGISQLAEEKYSTWEWNYGKSPAYNMRREKKFPSGLVSLYMQVEEGCIEGISIYGDFFGSGEIAELENALLGHKLDERLKSALEGLEVGHYISGVTAKDLYELMRY